MIYGFRRPVALAHTEAPRSRSYLPSLINAVVWTIFGLLQAATWMLAPIGDWYPNAWSLVAIALFNAYMWALITPFLFPLASKVVNARGRRLPWLAFVVLLGLLVAAVVALLAANFHGGVPWGQGTTQSVQSRFSFWALSRWYFEEAVLFFLVFAVGVATEMFRQFRDREHEAARLKAQALLLEAERAELNARLADARLAVLRSQLNPHFLFNTLNAVSALVVKDPVGVRDMIAVLSELLRSALTETAEEVPVEQEVEWLRRYLEILEIRYQGQLRTSVTVHVTGRDALVPRMILQPLVENAMKHGVAPASGDAFIEVRAWREDEHLVLLVRDSGGGGDKRGDSADETDRGTAPHSPDSRSSTDGAGVGLRLTRQRLLELYGDDHSFALVDAPGYGTDAIIRLPYRTSGAFEPQAVHS